MDQDLSRVIRRIEKLLALSESPHEAEAASALAKAQELLIEYGLSMSDIDSCRSDVVEERVGELTEVWEEKLLRCILSATFTQALRIADDETRKVSIVGKEANVVTARMFYEYLHEALERRAELFSASIADIDSFLIGMVDSIQQKLQSQNEIAKKTHADTHVIAVMRNSRAGEIEEYIRARYGKPTTAESWYGVDENSYGLGRAIGRKIPINRQVDTPDH